jgi:chaperone modulatory protein CbpM
MMSIDNLLEAVPALQRGDLEVWISEKLVMPQHEEDKLLFTEMECARVRLICTLYYELEVDAGTLPLVMSLVDQLYDARQRLLSLSAAISTQDRNVQAAIINMLARNAGSPE